MNNILNFFFVFITISGFSQGIINTESSLREISSGFNFYSSLDGDIKKGNIDLIEINSSIIFSYKFKNALIRLINGYEYLEEDGEVEANDFSTHLRVNILDENLNSLFLFTQLQSAKSIFQKRRNLLGIGYRFRIIKRNKSYYFDIAPGFFTENETYDFNEVETVISNTRFSLNNYFNLSLLEKLNLDCVTYFQINSKKIDDYRLYFEPKLIYEMNKVNFYFKYSSKFHSTPYINIKSKDQDLMFGIEININ